MGLLFIVVNQGGAGAADEPGGAEAGGGNFPVDDGEDFAGLFGGEGGVDPIVSEDDGVRASPGIF